MRHPDEGTIHAWLDGALDDADTAWIEAHTRECPACGALVAEARGLVAGASRVLGALDAVPGGVLPARTEPVSAGSGEVTAGRVLRRFAGRTSVERSSRWMVPMRAAAALLLVAGGTAVVMRSTHMPAMMGDAVEERGDMESVVSVPATSRAASAPSANAASAASDSAAAAPMRARVAAPAAPRSEADAVQQLAGSAAANARPEPPPQALAREERSERAERQLLEVAAAAIGRPSTQQRAVKAPLALRPAPESLAVPLTEVVVTGVVRDDHTGEPVAGASILLDNGDLGTITDHLGRFTITGTTTGVHRAQVRRMGYASVEREVSVVGDSSVLDVRLAPAGTSIAAALGPGYTDVERKVAEPGAVRDAAKGRAVASPKKRPVTAQDDRVDSAVVEASTADSPGVTTTPAIPPGVASAATRRGAPPTVASPLAPPADPPLSTRARLPRSTQREAAGSCLSIALETLEGGRTTVARTVVVQLLPTSKTDDEVDGTFALRFPRAADGARGASGAWMVVPRDGQDERTATGLLLHWREGDDEVRMQLDWRREMPDGLASLRRGTVGVDARATATRVECRTLKF